MKKKADHCGNHDSWLRFHANKTSDHHRNRDDYRPWPGNADVDGRETRPRLIKLFIHGGARTECDMEEGIRYRQGLPRNQTSVFDGRGMRSCLSKGKFRALRADKRDEAQTDSQTLHGDYGRRKKKGKV